MKKGLLLVFVLLAVTVSAQVNVPYDSTFPPADGSGVTRYSDFPLDNIHILRLQEASQTLGQNVSALQGSQAEFQSQQQQELAQMRASLDSFERSMLLQVGALQNQIAGVNASPAPSLEYPIGTAQFPPAVIALLGINVFLLIVVIILIFWLREQYYVHRETHKEEHIHPAPPKLINYVRHQIEHKQSLSDIRMELSQKGWTPGVIEHAIHAARER